jgi:hypothetical protein
MPVQVACPACGRQLKVPDNLLGKTVKCPGCQQPFQTSVDEPPPPSPPPQEAIRQEEPRGRDADDRYRANDERRPARRDDYEDDQDDERGSRRRRRRGGDYAPHRGTVILILGILGLVGCGLFTAIPAWIMGNNDMKEIRAGRMDPEGEQLTNIGKILGMVGTILGGIFLVLGCIWMIFVGIIAGAGAGAGR